jgi:polyisoprenoid-binding protein YceI
MTQVKLRHPVLLLLLTLPFAAGASSWDIDPVHSRVGFSVKHMKVARVHGAFRTVRGTLELDEKNPSRSRLDVTIDATSIDTGHPQRDGHLKSADFFDVENHPTLTFKSTKVTPLGKERFRVQGELTMRGISRPVVLEAVVPRDEVPAGKGEARRGATATGTLNRKDFGLTWNRALEGGGVLVSEEVALTIDVELKKKPAQAFTWPTPTGWKTETIPFPLTFAPELAYRGVEELRFAPGMFKQGAEDFWTYSFVWWLEGEQHFDAATLNADLKRYFEGLSRAVEKREDFDAAQAVAAVQLAPVREAGAAQERFQGSVDAYEPFTTHQRIALQVDAQVLRCKEAGRTVALFQLSPQPRGHAVWGQLERLREEFRCPQG